MSRPVPMVLDNFLLPSEQFLSKIYVLEHISSDDFIEKFNSCELLPRVTRGLYSLVNDYQSLNT